MATLAVYKQQIDTIVNDAKNQDGSINYQLLDMLTIERTVREAALDAELAPWAKAQIRSYANPYINASQGRGPSAQAREQEIRAKINRGYQPKNSEEWDIYHRMYPDGKSASGVVAAESQAQSDINRAADTKVVKTGYSIDYYEALVTLAKEYIRLQKDGADITEVSAKFEKLIDEILADKALVQKVRQVGRQRSSTGDYKYRVDIFGERNGS